MYIKEHTAESQTVIVDRRSAIAKVVKSIFTSQSGCRRK